MKDFSFLHLADIHLGYNQYHSPKRAADIATVFKSICEYAIKEGVNFILISGDLFHSPDLKPRTLDRAIQVLEKVRQANIPIYVIEGNHDRKAYRQEFSWLYFLSKRGYFKLLKQDVKEGAYELVPWDDSESIGSYIDYNEEVRIYGVGYLGSATVPILKQLAPQIESKKFTILMLHAGLKGYYPHNHEIGGIEYSDLAFLKNKVDYVALGHWHKNYEVENWVFNPGSVDTISIREMEWHHGFYHVKIINDKFHAKLNEDYIRRQFLLWEIDLERASVVDNDTAIQLVKDFLAEKKSKLKNLRKPVLVVRLKGILQFKKYELETNLIKSIIAKEFDTTLLVVENNTIDRSLKSIKTSEGKRESRKELEHRIIKELIMGTTKYQKISNELAELLIEVKNQSYNKREPNKILNLIKTKWGD